MDYYKDSENSMNKYLDSMMPMFKLFEATKKCLEEVMKDVRAYPETNTIRTIEEIKISIAASTLEDEPSTKNIEKTKEEDKGMVSVKSEKPDIDNKENQTMQNIEMPPPSQPLTKRARPKAIKPEPKKSTRIKEENKELEVQQRQSTRMRRTRTKIVEPARMSETRPSDIILQRDEISIIDLDTSPENSPVKTMKKSLRDSNASTVSSISSVSSCSSTRSKRIVKTKPAKLKRALSTSSDDVPPTDIKKTEKRKKTDESETAKPKVVGKADDGSIYEDARSSVESNAQGTASKGRNVKNTHNGNMVEDTKNKKSANINTIKEPAMNETIVVKKANNINDQTVIIDKHDTFNDQTVILEKPTDVKGKEKIGIDDLMTDDESLTPNKQVFTDEESDDNVPQKTTTKKIVKGVKQIFSPFENSPVKKRVEAFEKIAAEAGSSKKPLKDGADAPRITRSKKALKASSRETTSAKAKFGTPLSSSKIPTSTMSSTKFRGTPLKASVSNSSLIHPKTASALKASEQEYKERELKRKQKEMEAMRIRDAQMEEKKRKREEKHIKAQMIREEEEKKKQKLLEEQFKKEEEKYKIAMAEKEEKLKKQKADAERRRLQATKKALEEKRKDEERRKIEEQKKLDEGRMNVEEEDRQKIVENKKPRMAHKAQEKLPMYMTEKAPLLPTDDCYDSDDQDAEKNKKWTPPSWARTQNSFETLKIMEYTGHKIKNTLYCVTPNTPDLRQIFQNIDPRKLKRTSSAVWNKPPRFTMLPANTSLNESGILDFD